MREMMETLESRRLYSAAAIATAPSAHVEPSATTTIALAAGKFKGSSVSTKGFTTRLTMTLGKERAGGTIIGTFDYLSGFDFEMHLRLGADNTFHGTITTGTFAGTLTSGVISTSAHATIVDLSGHYSFSNGKGDGDTGSFLVRS